MLYKQLVYLFREAIRIKVLHIVHDSPRIHFICIPLSQGTLQMAPFDLPIQRIIYPFNLNQQENWLLYQQVDKALSGQLTALMEYLTAFYIIISMAGHSHTGIFITVNKPHDSAILQLMRNF